MRQTLNEGMWAGDLADLVQPIVSVDEYESKIDDSTVVIGFFVNDVDAADDLNRFIQKSAVPILDSDISSASDQRGYYIVFVELNDNDRLYQNIEKIIEEISNLAAIEHWQMKVRGRKSIDKLCFKTMQKAFLKNRVLDRFNAILAKLDELKALKETKGD